MIPLLDGNGYLIYLAGIAGLLHACLQMPSAVFLHMGGHAVGRRRRGMAFALGLAMSVGVFLTVGLLLIIATQIAGAVSNPQSRYIIFGILTVLAGLFIMLRYFHDAAGAQMWLPRKHIRWFHKQIENTGNIFGAFGMGMVAILAEIALSFPLLLATGAVLVDTNPNAVMSGLGIYAAVVTLPIIIAGILLSTGANPLGLQRWRIESKRFWQFFVGLAFIIFGLYVASGQFVALAGGAA